MIENISLLAGRVLNTPLLIDPLQARVVCGALRERFGINSFTDLRGGCDRNDLDLIASSYKARERVEKPYRVVNGTAVIQVVGNLVAKSGYLKPMSGMTGYDGIKSNLELAYADKDVVDILLEVDSGGGEVQGCFELCDYIFNRRGVKLIKAVVVGNALSAAYAIASSTSEIIVPELGLTGSVGVLSLHGDMSGAYANDGISITMISVGDHKTDGNPFEKLPDDVYNRKLDDMKIVYDSFTSRVARNRNMTVGDVVSTQALTLMGVAGVNRGFADVVGSPLEYLDRLRGVKQMQVPSLNSNSAVTSVPPVAAAPVAVAPVAPVAPVAVAPVAVAPVAAAPVAVAPVAPVAAAPVAPVAAAPVAPVAVAPVAPVAVAPVAPVAVAPVAPVAVAPVVGERDRIKQLLSCEQAAVNPGLANHIAFNTELCVADGIALMSASSTAVNPGANASSFEAYMLQNEGEPIGSDTNDSDGEPDSVCEVKDSMNAFNAMYGEL